MKKVILSLIAFFAMASVAHADPKPAVVPFDAVNVTSTVNEQPNEGRTSKKELDKHDKKEKKEKKRKKDHAEDSGDNHGKSAMALSDGEEDHHDKNKEKKSKKEHKHD